MLSQMIRQRPADQREQARESMAESLQHAVNPKALQEEFESLEVEWTPPKRTGFEPVAAGEAR